MRMFSLRRAMAVAKKEFYHIIRDPFTLAVGIVLPIIMVVVNGVAIEFNVKHIVLAVSDSDQTQSSRRLLEAFSSSQYFEIHTSQSPASAINKLTSEEARAALVIPLNFEKDLLAGRKADVQILLDGSDSATVGPILSYIGNIQNIASKRIADFDPKPPYEIRTRYLFNPELNSRWFIIPALNVLVMAILCTLLTALTVAREFENGSMELLLSTPIQPLEIVVGKLTPYGALSAVSLVMIYFLARLVFGVPFVGNHFVFALGALLFVVAYLGQGLLVSIIARETSVATQMAFLIGFLPTQFLSGFIFPIESMPKFLQYVTYIFPATWFMQISRDSFLKGSSFKDLAPAFLGLSIFVIVIITMSSRRFKRDIEP